MEGRMFRKTAGLILAVTLFVPSSATLNTGGGCVEQFDPKCKDGDVTNGYWWRKLVWIPFYPSVNSWFAPAPIWAYGNAVFYGPGAMSANAKIRGLSLDGYIDGVALMSPADIGLKVWLKKPDGIWEGPFLVVDCASHGDIMPIIKYRKEIVEVSWITAKRWGMVSDDDKILNWRLENVEVSKIDPSGLEGEPVNYPDWWLNQASPGTKKDLYTPYYKAPRTWLIDGTWITFEQPEPPLPTHPKTNHSDLLTERR